MSETKLLCLWVFSILVAFSSVTSNIPVVEAKSPPDRKELHLSLFFQLTANNKQLPDATVARALTAAIAVYHVNERWGGIAPVLEEDFARSCPINFTYNMIDTDSKLSVKSIRNLWDEIMTSWITFVIGPNSSPVAMPASLFLQVWEIPMISPFATASSLEKGTTHFARTQVTDEVRARALLRYLEKNDIFFVGLLFVESEYGSSFRNDLLSLSEKSSVTIFPVSFSRNRTDIVADKVEIRRALQRIQFINIVVTVFPSRQFIKVMLEAYELGMTGTGKNWITIGEMPNHDIQNLPQEMYTKVAKAINGTLHLRLAGNPPQNVNRLADSWHKSIEYLDDIRNHLPYNVTISPSFFNKAYDYRDLAFAYDSVVLAAVTVFRNCERVMNSSDPLDSKYGKKKNTQCHRKLLDHYGSEFENKSAEHVSRDLVSIAEKVKQQVLKQDPSDLIIRDETNPLSFLYENLFDQDAAFEGASGKVKLNKETKSRVPETVIFQMLNVLWKTESHRDISKIVASLTNHSWKLSNSILYPPGNTSIAPNVTDFKSDKNLIPRGVRIFVYSILGIVYLLCSFAFIFVCFNWNKPVMKASQPVLLLSLLAGIFIYTTSVIFVHPDENSLVQWIYSCQLAWSLWSFGTTLEGISLAVKLYKIHRVFTGGLKRVVIKTKFVVLVVTVCLSLNILILVLFSLFQPLVFKRANIDSSYDYVFKYYTASFGRCTTEKGSIWPFFSTILGIFIFWNVCISVIAYRTRKCPEDFQEAKYIFACQFSQLIICIMAIPSIYAIDESATSAQFVVSSMIILLSGLITLFLIFIPKFLRLHYGPSNVSYNDAKK